MNLSSALQRRLRKALVCRKTRTLVLLLAVVALVPLAGCGRSSNETVRDFFEDIDRGEINEAVALFSPDLKARFPEEELAQAARQLQQHMRRHQGLDKIKLTGGIITYNELALYDAKLSFGDGTDRKMQITVLYRNGNWFVNTAL